MVTRLDQELTRRVKRSARDELGARLVGVASVDRFAGAPRGHHPTDFLPQCRAVVVLGMPIVRGLMRWGEFMAHSEIVPETAPVPGDGDKHQWQPLRALQMHVERRCAYEAINDDLQTMSLRLACFIEEHGHEAMYLPTTFGSTHSWNHAGPNPVRAFGPFSHRHAAVAAGLGNFGKSNLFLAPRYGPRVRLVSVLTGAPLVPDPMCDPHVCLDKCDQCVTHCPAGAFGQMVEFRVGGQAQVMAKFDIEKCRDYYNRGVRRCNGECMTACPLVLRKLRCVEDADNARGAAPLASCRTSTSA